MKSCFRLFSLSALLVALGCTAAEPLRLDEISIVRFHEVAPGEQWIKHGLLSAQGGFRETETWPVLSSVVVPPAALNRNLISIEAWLAYDRLGDEAVANFSASTDETHYMIGERVYIDVAAQASPKISHGKLVNLSSRGLVGGDVPMIGGFVIDDQHRHVLLRVAGPALAAVGVTNALPDPSVTIYRGNTAVAVNDDWGAFSDQAALTEATSRVGATPFSAGSKDAALLIELPPGPYTAHVHSETGATGEVVLEIFSVPE